MFRSFGNSMPELFLVFDVANPNLVTGQRGVSTLPTQSLFLLNSPDIMKQAALAAQHFLATDAANSATVDMMVDNACRVSVGRSASGEERKTLTSYLEHHGPHSVDAWTAVFQSLFASMDFRYLD